jgi:hypothetical protein
MFRAGTGFKIVQSHKKLIKKIRLLQESLQEPWALPLF